MLFERARGRQWDAGVAISPGTVGVMLAMPVRACAVVNGVEVFDGSRTRR